MNRSGLITMLRRRLYQPTSGDDLWTDSELVQFLNAGYVVTALAYMGANPEGLVTVARRNLVADQHTYSWPYDMTYDLFVARLDGTTYKLLEQKPLEWLINREQLSSGTPRYFGRYGRFLYLDPAPGANLASGLQLTYAYAPGLSTDASIPVLPTHWHPLIAINAQILALGETSDQAQSAIAERNAVYADLLGAGRRMTGGRQTALQPMIDTRQETWADTAIWR